MWANNGRCTNWKTICIIIFFSSIHQFYKLCLCITCFDIQNSAAREDGRIESNIRRIFVSVGPVFPPPLPPDHFDRVHLEISTTHWLTAKQVRWRSYPAPKCSPGGITDLGGKFPVWVTQSNSLRSRNGPVSRSWSAPMGLRFRSELIALSSASDLTKLH